MAFISIGPVSVVSINMSSASVGDTYTIKNFAVLKVNASIVDTTLTSVNYWLTNSSLNDSSMPTIKNFNNPSPNKSIQNEVFTATNDTYRKLPNYVCWS